MRITTLLLDILFPRKCLRCSKILSEEGALCAACIEKIDLYTHFFCGKCHARIPDTLKICHKDYPLFGAACNYKDEAVRNLIYALKFKLNKSAAVHLGNYLSSFLKNSPLKLEQFSIIPIPLSAKRERTRGFNQSFLIAEVVSKNIGIPVIQNTLFRIKHTKPQSEIKEYGDRKKNIEGVFAVKNRNLSEKNILLIDDVSTSGATLKEAAKCLRAHGVKKIIALAAARA